MGLLNFRRTAKCLSSSINERKTLEPKIAKIILDKLILIDKLELRDTQAEITEIMDKWLNRGKGIRNLWNDHEELNSLFISAEAAADYFSHFVHTSSVGTLLSLGSLHKCSAVSITPTAGLVLCTRPDQVWGHCIEQVEFGCVQEFND